MSENAARKPSLLDRLTRSNKPPSRIQEMPAAIPGVGECGICFESIPCVKVLDCGHTLCLPCAGRLVQTAVKPVITCAECRQDTDCSRGLGFLRTRYFGKINCDVCLERKDAEDTWWCGDCVMAFCSKCSIKEHSSKQHTISEWNKMEPVSFSVNYINGVKFQRQRSTVSSRNERAIQAFLQEVERNLRHQLCMQPDLDELRETLLTRYGTRFSTDSSESTESTTSLPAEGGNKVIAKCLQLAGQSMMEPLIPRAEYESQCRQIYFKVPPIDIATYLRTKVEFVPGEKEDDTKVPSTILEEISSETPQYREKSLKRFGDKIPVLQLCYCPSAETVAIRTNVEVQLYSANSSQTYTIPMQKSKSIRDVCFGSEINELLLTYQSTIKKYEWEVEGFQLKSLPVTSLYTAEFNIDPEDRVEAMQLSVTGESNSNIYEVRLCTPNVSEIWKAVASKKKGKVKLKETMVYQKPNSRFTSLRVVCPGSGKEKFIFAWEELSNCLYRLVVKDNRCEVSTKVLHSSEPIPYCLDKQLRLWLYDPHLHQICVSRGTVLNRVNVTFDQVWKYEKHGFCGLWMHNEVIMGLSLSDSKIDIVYFEKDEER